jgi:hypothetical protein
MLSNSPNLITPITIQAHLEKLLRNISIHILELSVKYWYPVCFSLWSPSHAIVILYFTVYSLDFNHLFLILSKQSVSIPSFEYLTDNSIMTKVEAPVVMC